MKMCLNLGCGTDIKESNETEHWLNLDIRGEITGVNIVCDLKKDKIPVEDEFFDYVFAQDILEHFPLDFTDELMQKVKRVIKVGGELEVQVPNFELNYQQYKDGSATRLFESQSDCHRFSQTVFGKQDYEGNFHFQLFDKQRLWEVFNSNGFHIVEEWERGRGLNIRGEKLG